MEPAIVAPNRLPASLLGPLSMAAPLYHNLAVPLVCPLVAAIRTDNLKLKVSPGPMPVDEPRARVMVLRAALLNPLLPPGTSLSCPEPITDPFLSTSASRSNLVPTSSLFLSPIQTLAGPRSERPTELTVTVN